MVTEVPKKRCLPVSRLWQNLDGSLWQRQWLDLRHLLRGGLAKTGDPYLAPRWTPEFCRPICPTKKAYSCSVSGFAYHVMTCTSGTPLTAGCLLTKSKSLLVLIVISLRIPFERCLWISASPTLTCSLDPRRLTEATLTIWRVCPSGAQALEGAVRYAYPFNYQHEATTLLPNSDFLSLPDHVTKYGPVRAQTLGSSKRSHILRMGLRHRPKYFPHLKRFW